PLWALKAPSRTDRLRRLRRHSESGYDAPCWSGFRSHWLFSELPNISSTSHMFGRTTLSFALRRTPSTRGFPAKWLKSRSWTMNASARDSSCSGSTLSYQIAIELAEARLGSARIQIEALKATYRQQLADLQAAKDSADFALREYDRKRILAADQW